MPLPCSSEPWETQKRLSKTGMPSIGLGFLGLGFDHYDQADSKTWTFLASALLNIPTLGNRRYVAENPVSPRPARQEYLGSQVAEPYNPAMSKAVLALDTTAEAEGIQVEIWRSMSPLEKVQLTSAVTCSARKLALAGLRSRHPDASLRS